MQGVSIGSRKVEIEFFDGLFSKFESRKYINISDADELKKYSDLKDQGIITEEEFQAKKKKLLDLD